MEMWRRYPSDDEEYIGYYPNCVPSTVWKAVSATQQVFRKLLGRVSENRGMYPKAVPIFVYVPRLGSTYEARLKTSYRSEKGTGSQ